MATTGKVVFGNNAATTYSVNNTAFGKVSGDNVGGSYSPYSQMGATTGTVSGYAAGQQPVKSAVYQQGSLSQTYGNTFTSSPVTPVTTSLENKNVTYAQPQTTKITFGGKQFSNSYTPVTRYETSNYVAPATQYQAYQTYQSYEKPVEIQPVTQVQSIPIKEEVQVEQKVEQVAKVSHKGSKVEATPLVKESSVKKEKKGGCPSWLWPMLGILALLGLILGLLFGLGIFGRIGNANKASSNLQTSSDTVGPTSASTSTPIVPTPTIPTVTPTIPTITPTTIPTSTSVPASTTDFTAPATLVPDTTVPTTVNPTPQPQGGYTVIEETSIKRKNNGNQTSGQAVTSPTIDTTPSVVVTPASATSPATTSGDDFGIDPTIVAPAPVAATTINDVAVSPAITVPSATSYTAQPELSPVYTTYPTTSTQGYVSNPTIDFVQPTSAQ